MTGPSPGVPNDKTSIRGGKKITRFNGNRSFMLPMRNIPRKSEIELFHFTFVPPLFYVKRRSAVTPELMIDVERGQNIPSRGGDPRRLEPPWQRPVSWFQRHRANHR